jgi:hypothetical protein
VDRFYAITVCSYSMWAAVEFTHLKGEKIAAGMQHPRGIVEGHIQCFGIGRSRSAIVSLRKSVAHGEDIARLYAARLAGIGPDVIRLSGLERCGRAWVHQEWICAIHTNAPRLP